MTTAQKSSILAAIEREITSLGSAARVADKCDLNPSYISQMRNGRETEMVKTEHWMKVANALAVSLDGWKTVEIANTRGLRQMFSDAKSNALFLAVSNPAGSGKTAACRDFREANSNQAVFYYSVEHAAMGKNDFLHRLCTALGIDTKSTGYITANGLADKVIEFFVKRLATRPLLIIDEADKLNDKALCFFISLYNQVEGKMGCVILGTENLERKIKTGVKWQKNGFDEIDSRFGRKFQKLIGVTLADVRAICKANGIENAALQSKLFDECQPEPTMVGGQNLKVIRDLRPLRRKIEREMLLQQTGKEAAAA